MSSAETLHAAMRLHQAGNFQQAEAIYGQLLAADPNYADAWHLLGLAHYQQGRFEPAVECVGRAIALQPQSALFHSNLGEILRSRGQLAEAERSYREALRWQPNYAGALSNLGIVLALQGRVSESLAAFEGALQFQPDFAEAHYNRGLTLMKLNRPIEAIAAYNEALRWRPNYPDALNNLGLALQGQDDIHGALEAFAQALRIDPNSVAAYTNQGTALKKQGELERAAEAFGRALQIDPRAVEAQNNLGIVRRAQGRLDEAIACYRRSLELRPNYLEAYSNLGNALRDLGRLDEALEQYAAALAIDPQYAEAHIARSIIRLLQGDFVQGWPEFEWRWKRLPGGAGQTQVAPLWDGSPLAGRTILLAAEQGLGDTIHFARYVPLVKERGGRIVLACQQPLAALVARSFDIEVVPHGQKLPPCDVEAPMASLPGLFHTTLDSIPVKVPYLLPDAEQVAHWREELSARGGLRIGIAWRGNPQHPNDRWRSIPLAHFSPALAHSGIRFYSLQKDPTSDERLLLAGGLDAEDLSPRLVDMDTAAAVIASLDLVIACDSALAHLAGALARPTWVALPFAPDWRWLLDRKDNPWYPTMLLFRQPAPNDWADVFGRLRGALHQLAKETLKAK